MDSRAYCIACESKSSDFRSLCVLSLQCIICVRVVIRVSEEFRLYGSNRCVTSLIVRVLRTDIGLNEE